MQQHSSLCGLSSESCGEFRHLHHQFDFVHAVRYRAGSLREHSTFRSLNGI